MTELKKEAGGGTLFKGQCFGDEGRMVFFVAKEPPGMLETALHKTIQKTAGLSTQRSKCALLAMRRTIRRRHRQRH